MQYSDSVASKLIGIAELVTEVPPQTQLFRQGDLIDGYYVIVRGTVKIEQKAARYIDKPDMPPIVVRTCYDGDHFGEKDFFTARIDDCAIGAQNTTTAVTNPSKKKKKEEESEYLMGKATDSAG